MIQPSLEPILEHETPRLEVRDLFVRRGKAEVLHGVSVTVPPGEVVALLGNNGAGKSTTLRTISGLHRASAGQIHLEGVNIGQMSARAIVQRGISHVPEGRLIFPELSVLDNLKMGAYVRKGLPKEGLDYVLETFPALGNILHRRGGALSGGQQQMLAIGRGLVAQPKVLLLDEPSLGLAPIVVHAIADVLEQLRTTGLSILLVEQNAELALRLANWGYVLANGRVTVSGTAASLVADDQVQKAYLGI